jgi:hypothetical protein
MSDPSSNVMVRPETSGRIAEFFEHEADRGETREMELKTGAKASKLIKD